MTKALVSVALATVLSLPAAVLAQEKTAETRSRELFTQGADRYDAGDRKEALRLFEQSYALVARAKTLLNISVVLSELGRDVEAANTLAAYVVDPDADRNRLPKARELLAKIDEKVLRLDLDLSGEGAITVDRRNVAEGARLNKILRVAPGTHVVAVGLERKTVEGGAGEIVSVEIRGAKTEQPKPIEPPNVQKPITSGPIGVDPGGEPSDRSIVSHPALWTGVLAVVAAGVGTGYAFAFRATQDELDDVNANSGDHPFTKAIELRDRASDRALAANIAFGVAGAAALGTVVLYLVLDRDSERAEGGTALAPTIDANSLGVALSGRF